MATSGKFDRNPDLHLATISKVLMRHGPAQCDLITRRESSQCAPATRNRDCGGFDEPRYTACANYSPVEIERKLVTQQQQHWPTWVVVVAIIILIPPLVWALSSAISIIGALSIGGILLIGGVVALFVWGLGKADNS